MISKNFDINDFLAKIQDSSFDDFILLSNAEATAAERFYLRHRNDTTVESQKIRDYIYSIKALMDYARFEIVPQNGVSNLDVGVLKQIKAKSHTTFIESF